MRFLCFLILMRTSLPLRRDRLAKSEDDLPRAQREPSHRSEASEDTTTNDGGLREIGFRARTALLEAFDAGDMLGFLSAWSVSKENCQADPKIRRHEYLRERYPLSRPERCL